MKKVIHFAKMKSKNGPTAMQYETLLFSNTFEEEKKICATYDHWLPEEVPSKILNEIKISNFIPNWL